MKYCNVVTYTQYEIGRGMHIAHIAHLYRNRILTARGAERILRRQWRAQYIGNVTEITLPCVVQVESLVVA